MVQQAMGNAPGLPLFRRIGQRKERNDRSFQRRGNMHWPGIIGDHKIGPLDQSAKLREGERSYQRLSPGRGMNSLQDACDQLLLILSAS